MMAGIIGSILKKRADTAAAKHEHEKSHPALPHHTCLRNLEPFPQYPVKKLQTYTTCNSKPKGRAIPKMAGGGATVGDSVVNTISGPHHWSQEILDSEEEELDLKPVEGVKSLEPADPNVDIKAGVSYASLYVGLTLISLGATFFLAGLMDRKPGIHSIILQIFGPIVFFFGFLCAVFPLVQHLFPHLFPFIPYNSKLETKELTMIVPQKGMKEEVTLTSQVTLPCLLHGPNIYDIPNTPRVTLHSFNEKGSKIFNYSDSDRDSTSTGREQSHVSCPYEIQLKEDGELEREKWRQNEIIMT